jgi:putative ABC transport system substrate-binding protein
MRRRFFLGAAGVTALLRPNAARARRETQPKRLAIFSPFYPVALMQERSSRDFASFFAELRRRGWVEGTNLSVERYGKEQNAGDLDAMAATLVRTQPDAIFTIGPGTLELKARTATIPLVTFTYDPIALGLTQNLARPGGNLTGISVDTGPSIWGKRIELLREIFPAISKLGFLALRASSWELFLKSAIGAASDGEKLPFVTALVDLPTSEVRYRQAFAALTGDGADAIMVAENPETVASRFLIAESAAAARLPAMYALRDFVDAGGLMAYAPDLTELNQRAAADIDAILRGTKPGDIPFFQGTKYQLFINRKAADSLGLTVPPLLAARADEVIE